MLFELPYEEQNQHKIRDAPPRHGGERRHRLAYVDDGDAEYVEARGGDEPRHRRAQAVEHVVDVFIAAEFLKRFRDERDYDDRGDDYADCRDYAAHDAREVEADVGRHVDAYRPRRRFRYRYHVGDEALAEPAGALAELLKERYRRHSAADGEEPYFEEFYKKLKQYHLLRGLLLRGERFADDAEQRRADDYRNRRYRCELHQDEDRGAERDAELVLDALLPEAEHRVEYQRDDADSDAVHRLFDIYVVLEVREECGDYADDYDAGRDAAERGGDSARGAAHVVADEYGDVYCDDAGQPLADGVEVHHLLVADPALAFDAFALEYRQHRVAPAEGDGPHLEKRQI